MTTNNKSALVESMYLYQFDLPQNRAKLEAYRDAKDRSGRSLAFYVRDIFNMVRNTPAWGKPGTNDMLNKLLTGARATLTKAKNGKISSFRHAGDSIRSIDCHKKTGVYRSYRTQVALAPELSEEEFQQLLAVA